jgi:hypothetical protein
VLLLMWTRARCVDTPGGEEGPLSPHTPSRAKLGGSNQRSCAKAMCTYCQPPARDTLNSAFPRPTGSPRHTSSPALSPFHETGARRVWAAGAAPAAADGVSGWRHGHRRYEFLCCALCRRCCAARHRLRGTPWLRVRVLGSDVATPNTPTAEARLDLEVAGHAPVSKAPAIRPGDAIPVEYQAVLWRAGV